MLIRVSDKAIPRTCSSSTMPRRRWRRSRTNLWFFFWCGLFGVGFGIDASAQQSTEPAEDLTVPFFEGLGVHSRPIGKTSAEVQKYFDQGLAFLFAFNHDEAIRSFQKVVALDPDCAMAHWGLGAANGPHINRPVVPEERERAAMAAIAAAQKTAAACSPENQALIEALATRHSEPPVADRAVLDRAYAEAMAAAWKKFPGDADIGALYAESLMDLRPWDLWTVDGAPQPETPEILSTLEAVIKLNPRHPLALHLYIHAVEASPEPGRADDAADRLRNLQPGLGHMIHMPSHIDIRRGRWKLAVDSNLAAIATDTAYRKQSPRQEFYRLYMTHNHHMLAFASMMRGESARAMSAVREMIAAIPAEWVAVKENAAIADGFLAAPIEVLVRFGRWDEILAEPVPGESFPIATALWHHARAVAYAAKGNAAAARLEQTKFQEACDKTPAEATFGNNKAVDIFAVASPMLEGEILAAEEKLPEAIGALYAAVEAESKLRYDEPPDWLIPARHPLGAFLIKAGRFAEAETAYRADLKQWPANGWSLFGLHQALEHQGKTAEAQKVSRQLTDSWQAADVELQSSCKCVGN